MTITYKKSGILATFSLTLTLGVLGCGSLQAQDLHSHPVSIGEDIVSASDRKGTIGHVDESALRVVIEDTEYTLAPLVSHNGSQWNRDRVSKSLQKGDFVEYEARDNGSQHVRTIIRIDNVVR